MVAAGGLAGHWLSAGSDATQIPLDWLGYVLIGIGAAALVARRRQAIDVLAVAGVAVAAMFVLDIDHEGSFILLPLLVALYTAAEGGRRTAAIVTSALVLGTFGLLVLLSPSQAGDGAVGLLWASGWIAAGIVTVRWSATDATTYVPSRIAPSKPNAPAKRRPSDVPARNGCASLGSFTTCSVTVCR